MEDLYSNSVPVISIISSKSGIGKTTLIEKIIKVLKNKKYKVGIIKHDVHKFEVDYPGKDSYRFTKAGADNVVIASNTKLAMINNLEEPKNINELLWLFKDVDIVIVEGFKGNSFPKIEVHRKEMGEVLIYKNIKFNYVNFIAVASNEKLNIDIPLLDINNIESIAQFIENVFLGGEKNG